MSTSVRDGGLFAESGPRRAPADPHRGGTVGLVRGAARPARRELRRGSRRGAGGHRRQRRRQVDAAEVHHRHDEPRPGGAHRRHHRHARPAAQPVADGEDRRCGGDHGAGGATPVPAPDGARQPARGRLPAALPGEAHREARDDVRPLSAARGAKRPARQPDVRRRAADGGDRPGAHVGTADHPVRRALARPSACGGRRHLRKDSANQRPGHHLRHHRAGHEAGARRFRPRHRAAGGRGGAAGRSRGA